MNPEELDTDLERFHYHMQQAQRYADKIAGVETGQSSKMSQFIYGIQIAADKFYGDN